MRLYYKNTFINSPVSTLQSFGKMLLCVVNYSERNFKSNSSKLRKAFIEMKTSFYGKNLLKTSTRFGKTFE